MTLIRNLFRRPDPKQKMAPLYAAVVARGREPHWYAGGQVPDTIDGRFDMIAAILTLVLLRLEQLGAAQEGVWLTETFVDDMDAQLREIGIGDIIVGKHIGRMMGALGGRIGAYRAALAKQGPGTASLEDALTRNLYRGASPPPEALAHVADAIRAFSASLDRADLAALEAGALPS